MTVNKDPVREYLKKARKHFPYKLRKRLDSELKYSLDEFCDSHETVTMEELEKQFGNPEHFAREYLCLHNTDVGTGKSFFQKVRFEVLITIMIIVIATIGTMMYIINWNENNNPEYIYDMVEEESF